jgi:hypothetical protein
MDGEASFFRLGVCKLTYNCSSKDYMQILAIIGNVKKFIKGPTTMYGAFVSKKLKEANEGMLSIQIFDRVWLTEQHCILGKEIGDMITLLVHLKVHPELHVKFHALSDEEKAALLSNHLQDKEEK